MQAAQSCAQCGSTLCLQKRQQIARQRSCGLQALLAWAADVLALAPGYLTREDLTAAEWAALERQLQATRREVMFRGPTPARAEYLPPQAGLADELLGNDGTLALAAEGQSPHAGYTVVSVGASLEKPEKPAQPAATPDKPTAPLPAPAWPTDWPTNPQTPVGGW